MRTLNILSILCLVTILQACDNETWIEYLKTEYIPKSAEGKIIDIKLTKGAGINLILSSKLKSEEFVGIHTDDEILMQIKKGDYFKKKANSNKCFIERGDSIIYIDCYRLTDQERDSLGKIDEWKPKEKNHWDLIKK